MSQSPEPIYYTLRFPAPSTHYVEVEAIVPSDGRPCVELTMAVWTPGSYLVREYARHLEQMAAQTPDGTRLAVDKSRKNRWRIQTNGTSAVHVAYRVYCREMSVRTNWVEADFALLNGAPTFVTLVEDGPRRHDVTLLLPEGWQSTMTGLPPVADGTPHHYWAADFDTLVDSPILAGNPAVYAFEVDGKPHYLVHEGAGDVWDGARSARDVEQLVWAHRHMWGSLPYDQYVFLNLLTEAAGGLEHLNSTVLMASRWQTRTRRSYLDWLGLVSHEFFHVWNGKRLRPVELGPFDYENEAYTRSLWVVEGITSYYTELGLRRAGLCTDEEVLERLSRGIDRLQNTPGRLVHSLAMASYDAWIKFYRNDENSLNTTISYYTKGAVVAFLLDARVQQATAGAKCLDDVLRLAYARYAGPRGFTPEEFQATAQEVAGVDLTAWFDRVLASTDELDYSEALAWFGLRFATPGASSAKAWLGLSTRMDGGRLVVTQVPRHTPGWQGGINVDDELLALDDYRVRPEQWDTRLEQYRPGDQVSILLARRDRLQRLNVTLGTEPPKRWRLEVHPEASVAQHTRRAAWLRECPLLGTPGASPAPAATLERGAPR
jgi:predicted metalloprotease with PDZ domain